MEQNLKQERGNHFPNNKEQNMDMTEKDKVQAKIDKYWEEYRMQTDKLSGVLRQLAFLEAGAFWIFLYKANEHSIILNIGFLTLILFFASDAIQYYNGFTSASKLAKSSEDKFIEDQGITVSDIAKHPDILEKSKFFFYAKIVLITLSSLILLGYLFHCPNW